MFTLKEIDKNKKQIYEKPVFVKEKEMTFLKDIIEKNFNGGQFCMQCAACHGCR